MHSIRLRGPWQLEVVWRYVLDEDGTYRHDRENLPAAVRMTMPADWSAALGGDFLGRVRYCRTFQKPTGLESGERVWLVVESPRSAGVVELNRKRLGDVRGGEGTGRFDITELLEDHNRLEILVEHPAVDDENCAANAGAKSPPGGLVGEVRLEIEE
jgi:hypothetical protein